jgi:hypothetical protein
MESSRPKAKRTARAEVPARGFERRSPGGIFNPSGFCREFWMGVDPFPSRRHAASPAARASRVNRSAAEKGHDGVFRRTTRVLCQRLISRVRRMKPNNSRITLSKTDIFPAGRHICKPQRLVNHNIEERSPGKRSFRRRAPMEKAGKEAADALDVRTDAGCFSPGWVRRRLQSPARRRVRGAQPDGTFDSRSSAGRPARRCAPARPKKTSGCM